MSFSGKNAVVVGATGVVGSGIVQKYLEAGATVVAVSRSGDRLKRLAGQLGTAGGGLKQVVAEFDSEDHARQALAAVEKALDGAPIDHVVSSQGFIYTKGSPTETSLEDFRESLNQGLFNNWLAAKVFLPVLQDREGASFTLVTGGFGHVVPPDTSFWMGAVKNAALQGLALALTAEAQKGKARVNEVCIHVSIGPLGGDVNQFGWPQELNTLDLAPAFLGLAAGAGSGEIHHVGTRADVDKLAGSLVKTA